MRDGHCFGVPIFGLAGDVGAAISVSLPKARVQDADHQKTILGHYGLRPARLRAICAAIGRQMVMS